MSIKVGDTVKVIKMIDYYEDKLDIGSIHIVTDISLDQWVTVDSVPHNTYQSFCFKKIRILETIETRLP